MTETTVLLLFFVAVLGGVLGAGYLVLSREESTAGSGQPETTRQFLAGTLHVLGELVPAPKAAGALRRKLVSAGYRAPNSVSTFNGISWSLAGLLGIISAIAALIARGSFSDMLLPAICGAGFGYLLPNRGLERAVKSRAERISAGLPTALDMLVLSVESGQALDQSIADTAREIRRPYPDLSDELQQVQLQLRASTSRADVFRDLSARVPDFDVRKLCNLLIDSDRFGTSLGPTLRTHARYLRIRRRQVAQERARKVGAKLVFPIFFLIFPSVLLVTLGPAVLQIMSSLGPLVNGK